MGAQVSEYCEHFMTQHRESVLEDSRNRKGAQFTLKEYRDQFMTNHRESLFLRI